MNELSQFLVESILGEADSVDNVVVVYAGRFQPFHKGHFATYSHLVKKFGKNNVFIGTSDKTDNQKSPFNFKEKQLIMTKMFGIPSNRIVNVKNPYAPTEVLNKFDEKTTAFVTVVGEKDSSRLGGKYFEKYKDNTEFQGYKDKGYVYIAPAQSNPISGTDVRIGLRKGSDEDKKNFFVKRAYGKYDDKIFNLIVGKLSSLPEVSEQNIWIPKQMVEEWLVNNSDLIIEASATTTTGGDVDDGPNFFFPSFASFNKISEKRAIQVGYMVLSQIMSDELTDIDPHPIYPKGPVKAVTPFPAGVIGKLTANNQKDFYGNQAYPKWFNHVTRAAALVGYSLVDSILTQKDKKEALKIRKIPSLPLPIVDENIDIPVKVGDTILTGKFKNKKTVVKDIGKDEHGMPTINGKKVVTFRMVNEGTLNEIPMADLQQIDKYADKQLNPIDVVLTDRHFFERLTDPRNDKPISAAELTGFFKRIAKNKKKFLEFLEQYGQIVAKDNRTNINIPFMKQANKVIAKTVMRKDNYMTSNPIYKFEDKIAGGLSQGMDITDIANKHKVDIDDLVKELQDGIKVEMEHTTDRKVAEEIALDHLFEDPKYYTKLQSIENPKNEYVMYRTHIMKPVDKGGMSDEINELTKGELFGGKIKIGGVSVPLEVELLGADNKKKVFVTKVINIDRKYLSKLPSNGILEIPARIFRTPGGGWYKIKTPKAFENLMFGYPDQKWVDNHEKELKRLRGKFNKEKGKDQYYEPALGGGLTEGLIMEGGAYGHMNHPFDTEINLTFGQLKDIVNRALDGELELTREKTDGQALAISWVNGRLVAARNKGHLANRGANALDAKGVATKFSGRGELEKAYNFAMNDLSKAIGSLSEKQKEKIFKNGACFMNLEVIYPTSVNVIPYGQPLLVFHGTMEYNEKGEAIGENQQAAKILAGMIKQVNQNVQSNYTIQGPPVTQLPKSQKLSSLKGKYNSQISKLQSEFKLSDNDGIGEYHQAWWTNFVQKKAPTAVDNKTLMGLVKRWAFYDKSFRLDNKNITDPKVLEWAQKIDKEDHAKIAKNNIRPFEDIFLGVGSDVLSFMSSVLTANPDSAVRSMKQRLDQTISDVQKGGDPKKIAKLKLELERLNAIGGKDKIVPNEGIVFVYGGKTFKLTGTFAPLNQILGLFYE